MNLTDVLKLPDPLDLQDPLDLPNPLDLPEPLELPNLHILDLLAYQDLTNLAPFENLVNLLIVNQKQRPGVFQGTAAMILIFKFSYLFE